MRQNPFLNFAIDPYGLNGLNVRYATRVCITWLITVQHAVLYCPKGGSLDATYEMCRVLISHGVDQNWLDEFGKYGITIASNLFKLIHRQ